MKHITHLELMHRIGQNQELRDQVHEHMMTLSPMSDEWEADSGIYAGLALEMDRLAAECMRRDAMLYA